MQTTADRILTRNAALKSKASHFRTLWEVCANYCLPRKGQIITQRPEGQNATETITDTTAGKSLRTFAAGLLQYLTPKGQMWAKIQSAEREPSGELKRWFEVESEALMEELLDSNFYEAIHEAFFSLGTFGTCCVHLEEGAQRPLNFKEIRVGSFSIQEDNESQVDTVYREWKWTARQAEQQWGKARLGKGCQRALESESPNEQDKEFTFVHAVFPRRSVTGGSSSEDGDRVREDGPVEGVLRPVASVYVCVEDRHVILEDGYYEMAYATCRLLKANGDTYGYGPPMEVLPDLWLINRMNKDVLVGYERMINPPVMMPEDSAYRPDNRPGGITYWDASNPNNKPEFMQVPVRVDLAEAKLEGMRARIEEAWSVRMFQVLNNDQEARRQKTAFEVEQMLQEKIADFSPMFSRITTELLGPLLERAFALRLRSGRASAAPVDMGEGGVRFKIAYTGEFAMRLKAMQDRGTVQAMSLCGQLAQLDPSVVYVIDWREQFRTMAKNFGVPALMIRSEKEVDEIMAAQQQAQGEAMQAQQVEQMSKAMKNLGPGAQAMATEQVANAV